MSFGGQQSISQKPEIQTEKQQPHLEDTTLIQPKAANEIIQTQLPAQTPSKYKAVQIAEEYNVDVELLLAIIYAESNFNPLAVSKSGAAGLMQMMPHTARELGLKVPKYSNKVKPTRNANIDERFNPTKNLHAGLTYYKKLLEKYRGDLTLTLGAYNVGPGRVRVRGPLISRGKRYAKKVITRSQLYRNNTEQIEVDLKRLEAVLNN
ncbi:hypothetical protein C6496_12795 [Candidatus Poribacteria bacterium]|nr:MAG: hypothetical protein C6496_12795 [Candidatus Poribacteria bacterium]